VILLKIPNANLLDDAEETVVATEVALDQIARATVAAAACEEFASYEALRQSWAFTYSGTHKCTRVLIWTRVPYPVQFQI
jgi:hypothetical protein